MNKIKADYKYLIALGIIFLLILIPTYAHHGHFLLDCGREVYYPKEILSGKLLYKDILNIYGPFSYLFNAFLFKVFRINLNVLFISGIVSTAILTSVIYFIAKRFMSALLSFSISASSLILGVFNLNLPNFIFPYSYAMLYGLCAFLLSLLFLLKFVDDDNDLNFYAACFFAGVAIANKYEFLSFLLVLIYVFIKRVIKKQSRIAVRILNFMGSVLLCPLLCFGFLFLQGVSLGDFLNTLKIIKTMSQTQTLYYFYSHAGVYFNFEALKLQLLTLNSFLILVLFLCLKPKNKVLSVLYSLIAFVLIVCLANNLSFSFLPILVVLMLFADFIRVKSNLSLQVLVLSAISLGIKVFWGLLVAHYGIFFFAILLIALIALILNRFEIEIRYQKMVAIYLILVSSSIAVKNYMAAPAYLPVKSEVGTIYAPYYIKESSDLLIDFINKNTKLQDKIVIYPEGAMINFITNRRSDDFYTSLIPLYAETFADARLIENLKSTSPEYVIFSNLETSDYYLKYICSDYSVEFCNYVANNYKKIAEVDSSLRYLIFKKK